MVPLNKMRSKGEREMATGSWITIRKVMNRRGMETNLDRNAWGIGWARIFTFLIRKRLKRTKIEWGMERGRQMKKKGCSG